MTDVRHTIITGASFLLIAAIVIAPFIPSIVGTLPIAQSKAQPIVATATRQEKPVDPQVIQGNPRHILVPSLGIDVAINDGVFDPATQLWTITEESAFYATPTSPINNDNGSTLIYGHNSTIIFGKLPQIQPGAEAIVTTDTGYTFTYTYKDSETVDPTNTAVLNYSGAPRIMLQTCTGFWNEHRQMFYFYLKDFTKK